MSRARKPAPPPVSPTLTLRFTDDEAEAVREVLSLAGDCAALWFGVDNAGSGGLGERGHQVARRALFNEMEKLEAVVKILDDANIAERIRLARVAAQQTGDEVRR